MLSNLCVADLYRGHGVGRMLVDAVLALPYSAVYLMIAVHGLQRRDERQIVRAFEARVSRLQKTYERLAFFEAGRCDRAILMCRPCGAARRGR